jgi:acyl-coenzyme A thioesterase PaaI-like protein
MSEHSLMDLMEAKLGERVDKYQLPPPVFEVMGGEFLDYDVGAGWLRARFPVLEAQLNPYGAMQGGMVAAAIDNTLGPLSMLVAPPNVTRRLTVKYSRQVTIDMERIIVEARLVKKEERWLRFRADVRDPDGRVMARASALHWVLDDE